MVLISKVNAFLRRNNRESSEAVASGSIAFYPLEMKITKGRRKLH
jgi:hypothetical protein